MMVLVDTSVWSLALRRPAHRLSPAERAIVKELSELIDEGRAKMIGLIRQELLSGIKDSAQFEKLKTILRAYPDEPLEISDYEAAALASNQCRSEGIAVTAVDMLVGAVARSRGWSVFTTDPDFKHQASVVSLKLHHPKKH